MTAVDALECADAQRGVEGEAAPGRDEGAPIEAVLLAVTRLGTFAGEASLTNATGFFFEREHRLYLITSRHVVIDAASNHRPDRIEIDLHVDPKNVAQMSRFNIPLYSDGSALWRETSDSSGMVDVVAIELDRGALPRTWLMHAYTPSHLVQKLHRIEVGTSVSIVGFPLGFHDELHHLPVVRQAIVASSFGIRFAGNGYFLTDANMHRGASGAPVVARADTRENGRMNLSWNLLGVHAARVDVARDIEQDSRLNLNCAWYSDVLMTLTEAHRDRDLAADAEADQRDEQGAQQLARIHA